MATSECTNTSPAVHDDVVSMGRILRRRRGAHLEFREAEGDASVRPAEPRGRRAREASVQKRREGGSERGSHQECSIV